MLLRNRKDEKLMNVGIISASNIRFSPFIYVYTSIFEKMGIEYELIIANRRGVEDPYDGTVHILPWASDKPAAVAYALYAQKVIKLIKKRKYDALVVLTTNNAVYLSLWLEKHYAGRYIVDIRDYTHEYNKLYFWLEKKALLNSALNIVSSDRYKTFLPEGEYYVCHNLPIENVQYPVKEGQTGKEQLVIGYLGVGAYLDNCVKLMDLVEQDERFRMEIHGLEAIQGKIAQITNGKKYEKVTFCGPFTSDKKREIINGIDMLFNLYGNGTPLLKTALSNKLYDALYHRKPILTSPNTYMDEIAGKLAFAVDFDRMTSLDELYEWYNGLDWKEIDEFSGTLIDQILMEHKETMQKIEEAVQSLNIK